MAANGENSVLTTEDVAMHCTCKREYVTALLLEEKPQEMEIEVSLSLSLQFNWFLLLNLPTSSLRI